MTKEVFFQLHDHCNQSEKQEGIRHNYKLNIEKEILAVYEVVYRTIKYYKI